MKTVTNNPAFQGDVMILRVNDIPAGLTTAKPEGDVFVIAHSETGHHHVIDRAKAEVFEAADNEFCAFIRVTAEKVDLEHRRSFDTHETLELPRGDYMVRRQREYIPEGYRRAAD